MIARLVVVEGLLVRRLRIRRMMGLRLWVCQGGNGRGGRGSRSCVWVAYLLEYTLQQVREGLFSFEEVLVLLLVRS